MPDTPRAPAIARDPRARRATAVIFLANGLGFGAWAASIPGLKAARGLSDGTLGLMLLGIALGAVLTMPVVGRLTGRLGTHRPVVASGLLFALVLAAIPFVPGLGGFALALLLLGAANGAMDVSMNTHAALVERKWGAAIMSSFHAAFSLGGLLGAAGVGALLAAGPGPAACLPAAAAAVALLVALSMPGLRAGGRDGSAAAGHGFAWPGRALLGLGLLAFLVLFAEGAVADWSALYLVGATGASGAAAAAGFAAFSLAMTAGRLLGDAAVRRLGGPRTIRLGGLLALAGVGLMLGLPRLEAGVAGLAMVGLGLANAVPVLVTIAGRSAAGPGAGVAAVATVGYAGLLAGPPLIGLAAEAIGLRAALLLLAAALAVVSLAAGRLRPA